MQQLCLQQAKLEGLLCLGGQDLDVAVVDELQHSTEQPAHLCSTPFICYCFKAHRLNLHCSKLLSSCCMLTVCWLVKRHSSFGQAAFWQLLQSPLVKSALQQSSEQLSHDACMLGAQAVNVLPITGPSAAFEADWDSLACSHA